LPGPSTTEITLVSPDAMKGINTFVTPGSLGNNCPVDLTASSHDG
jgi:hypothetical protein